jgi:uncharacterized protein
MLQNVMKTLLTLAIGAVGGYAFFHLQTPLPWLLGAFATTLLVTVTTGALSIDWRLRAVAMPIMGVLIGSSFQPEVLEQISRWPGGMIAAGFYTFASSALGFVYFTRVARWDPQTALCAAPPGGLVSMLSIAIALKGDERRVILAHSVRIAIVVVMATLTIRYVFDYSGDGLGQRAQGPSSIAPIEWLILGACAAIGGWLGVKLRLPGGSIFGALILSAIIHILGVSHTSPPGWIVASVQVILGATLGVRFVGMTREEAATVAIHSAIWAVALLIMAFGFALLISLLIGFDPRALFLAFAPGGFAEMLLVAVAIGIESAFVATCHVVRLLVIFIGVPLAAMLVGEADESKAISVQDKAV